MDTDSLIKEFLLEVRVDGARDMSFIFDRAQIRFLSGRDYGFVFQFKNARVITGELEIPLSKENFFDKVPVAFSKGIYRISSIYRDTISEDFKMAFDFRNFQWLDKDAKSLWGTAATDRAEFARYYSLYSSSEGLRFRDGQLIISTEDLERVLCHYHPLLS